jgi:hypothetical protein
MHHMLFAHMTGPKRQLSFECSHSKNDNLLCLGKMSMGVTCDVLRTMHAGGLRAISSFFFQPLRPQEKLKTHKNIKKRPWSTEESEEQATVTFQPPGFLSSRMHWQRRGGSRAGGLGFIVLGSFAFIISSRLV